MSDLLPRHDALLDDPLRRQEELNDNEDEPGYMDMEADDVGNDDDGGGDY